MQNGDKGEGWEENVSERMKNTYFGCKKTVLSSIRTKNVCVILSLAQWMSHLSDLWI